MGLPRKLKKFNLFNDGYNHMGQVPELKLPKLSRKMEDWKGGGMDGTLKVDMGQEAMELEWSLGGFNKQVQRQFGIADVQGVMLRFVGAYQADNGSAPVAVEIAMRGRHEEVDPGDQKAGGDTEIKIKTAVAYYKQVVDGVTEMEIDVERGIFIVGGVDRMAEIRSIIGT